MIYELEEKFKAIQSLVKTSFENLEPLKDTVTTHESWKRPEGGGGITNVMAGGDFLIIALSISHLSLEKISQTQL